MKTLKKVSKGQEWGIRDGESWTGESSIVKSGNSIADVYTDGVDFFSKADVLTKDGKKTIRVKAYSPREKWVKEFAFISGKGWGHYSVWNGLAFDGSPEDANKWARENLVRLEDGGEVGYLPMLTPAQ